MRKDYYKLETRESYPKLRAIVKQMPAIRRAQDELARMKSRLIHWLFKITP